MCLHIKPHALGLSSPFDVRPRDLPAVTWTSSLGLTKHGACGVDGIWHSLALGLPGPAVRSGWKRYQRDCFEIPRLERVSRQSVLYACRGPKVEVGSPREAKADGILPFPDRRKPSKRFKRGVMPAWQLRFPLAPSSHAPRRIGTCKFKKSPVGAQRGFPALHDPPHPVAPRPSRTSHPDSHPPSASPCFSAAGLRG